MKRHFGLFLTIGALGCLAALAASLKAPVHDETLKIVGPPNFWPAQVNDPAFAAAVNSVVSIPAMPDNALTNADTRPVSFANTVTFGQNTLFQGTANNFLGSNYFAGPVRILSDVWMQDSGAETRLTLATGGVGGKTNYISTGSSDMNFVANPRIVLNTPEVLLGGTLTLGGTLFASGQAIDGGETGFNITGLSQITSYATEVMGISTADGAEWTGPVTFESLVTFNGGVVGVPTGDVTAAGQNNFSGSNYFGSSVRLGGPNHVVVNASEDISISGGTGVTLGDGTDGTWYINQYGDARFGGNLEVDGTIYGTLTGYITTSPLTNKVQAANIIASGSPSASTFLRGDYSWATVAGSGDVVAAGQNNFSGSNYFGSSVRLGGPNHVVINASEDISITGGTGVTLGDGTDGTWYINQYGDANFEGDLEVLGTIYGSLSGNASSATTATSATTAADSTRSVYVTTSPLTNNISGNAATSTDATRSVYVTTSPLTNNISGNAATASDSTRSVYVTTSPLTNNISGNAATADDAIRSTYVTSGQLTNKIGHTNILTSSGSADSTTYLRGDGTWSTPAGGSGTGISTNSGSGTNNVFTGPLIFDAILGGDTIVTNLTIYGQLAVDELEVDTMYVTNLVGTVADATRSVYVTTSPLTNNISGNAATANDATRSVYVTTSPLTNNISGNAATANDATRSVYVTTSPLTNNISGNAATADDAIRSTYVTTSPLTNKVNADKIVATGSPSATTFLRGDYSWATPTGSGGGVLMFGGAVIAQNWISTGVNRYTMHVNGGGTEYQAGGTIGPKPRFYVRRPFILTNLTFVHGSVIQNTTNVWLCVMTNNAWTSFYVCLAGNGTDYVTNSTTESLLVNPGSYMVVAVTNNSANTIPNTAISWSFEALPQ